MIEVGDEGQKIEDVRNLDVPEWVKFFKQLGPEGVFGILIFFVLFAMWLSVSKQEWSERLVNDRLNVRKEQLITLSSIVLIILFFASGGLPYSFYIIGKFIVFSTCIWLAIESYQQKKYFWFYTMLLVVLTYNPIVGFSFGKVWHVLNFATIAYLVYAYNSLKFKENQE